MSYSVSLLPGNTAWVLLLSVASSVHSPCVLHYRTPFYHYGGSIHFLGQLVVIEHPPHPDVALCSRKPNRKSCLHGARVAMGTKVSKQGKCMVGQLVAGVVEKENVGNGEQRMPAWEGAATLRTVIRGGFWRGWYLSQTPKEEMEWVLQWSGSGLAACLA